MLFRSLEEAEKILKRNEECVIIKLDLKRYYYNIKEKKLKEKLELLDENILDDPLTEIMLQINEEYTKKVKEKENDEIEGDEERGRERESEREGDRAREMERGRLRETDGEMNV